MKKPKTIEGFNCVQMQREIREKISEEIKNHPDTFFKELEKEFAHFPKANRSIAIG